MELFQEAVASGKPVALISDMFLPQRLIEKVLNKFGFTGWDELFLSNTIGQRKDTGELYKHVCAHYAIKPEEMLMIGDNERSDVQIPCDMGASFFQFIKPVELARGLPRFSNLLEQHERCGDIDAEVTLGLVIRKNFAPVQLPPFDPFSLVEVSPYQWGYSLVGPLLVSFTNWLIRKSQEDGIERLYFLSREGKFIRQIYDQWSEGLNGVPKSEYLVLSRRTAGVAAITTLKDILEIAKTIFYPNTLEGYLYTRFGLTINDERWNEISRTFGLGRSSKMKVFDHKIDHVQALLQAFEPEIMTRVKSERVAILSYLTGKGLTRDGRQAVVDIGYGGSIQKYLNILLEQNVHGYYMMTNDSSQEVAREHAVLLRSCFHEDIDPSAPLPVMFRHSFAIEKLLSSDDPQIEYYALNSKGILQEHFRALTHEETACNSIRRSIRLGAADYTRDALQIRTSLLPDFQPSCWTAQMLMDSFLSRQSTAEAQELSKIVLDDHYCGRGLVS